jgi:hypothetical protein
MEIFALTPCPRERDDVQTNQSRAHHLSYNIGKKLPLARVECRLVAGLRADPKTRALKSVVKVIAFLALRTAEAPGTASPIRSARLTSRSLT